MLRFKKTILGSTPASFQLFSKDKALQSRVIKGNLTAKVKHELCVANRQGLNIAMMINGGSDRKSSSVTKVNALFCDCDTEGWTKERLLNLPVTPHLITETSPGRFHSIWLIADCPVTKFTPIQKALAKAVGSDLSVSDLARVMRLPGTLNHKVTPPFLARIVYANEAAKPIRLKSFCKKFQLSVDADPPIPKQSVTDDRPSLEDIESALKQISPEDRKVWRDVGMAIHSAYPSKQGLQMWTSWSSHSPKFDEEEHRQMWGKFNSSRGITIHTLFWMANLARRAAEFDYDESGLANLFTESSKDKLKYCPAQKKWYSFNGTAWHEVPPQLPHSTAREMLNKLSAAIDDRGAKKSLNRFDTVAGYRAITSHAELIPELQIDVAAFDRNPNLLAVKNGVVDLTTGAFRAATPGDLLRRQANVAFDPEARAPGWINFLKEVTCSDRELYEYIRRVVGYILFGRANEQLFFLIMGSGGNGKGALMRTLKLMLGDYATDVPPNLLTTAYSGNANAPSPTLAKLNGARFVICTELKPERLDEAFVKQFAGGDEITARHAYGEVFTFKPEGKLVVSANHNALPEIAAEDEAMWRRLIPIPFNAKFEKGKNEDSNLEERFIAEFPGILNWILKGAITYHQDGLGSCAAVEKTKDGLRKDADSLLSWMSERCTERSSLKTAAGAAYESYRAFMDYKAKKPLTVQAFKAGLGRKGFHHKQTSKHNVYVGFGLR